VALALAGTLVADATGSSGQPPILYDSALRCASSPGKCSGVKYDARIYEIARIGYPARALTSGSANDTNPVWSPDRTKIAFFSSGSSARAPATLWIMNADGTGQHQLSSTPVGTTGFDVSSTWSGGFGDPTWSPDGNEIAFVAKAGDLDTIRTDGTGLTDLTAGMKSLSLGAPPLYATYPNWMPGGSEIAFDTDYGKFASVVEIPAAGGAAKLLFTRAAMPALATHGTTFAVVVSEAKGLDQIGRVSRSGGSGTLLTHTGDNREPSWSPDGTMLVYVHENQITVMNADGTGVKQVTRHNPAVFVENPSW
jgi:Tol biopolymer transport system component